MNVLTLTLSAQNWFAPIADGEEARLALRTPRPFIVDGRYQLANDQIVPFASGVAEFRALGSADLTALGFADAYYVLTVNYKAYPFWLASPGDALFDGASGETPGDLSRLIQLIPTDGGLSPPPGAGVSQRILEAVAQVERIAADLAGQNAVDRSYRHRQSAAAALWVVQHDLGKRPAVSVVDSAGSVVIGDVEYTDDNQCIIRFNAPFAGDAYCN